MVQVRYGGRNGGSHELAISDNHLVVRTLSRQAVMPVRPFEVSPVGAETNRILDQFETLSRFREAGVELLNTRTPQADGALRDTARSLLKAEPAIDFAGRVLVDAHGRPVVYTENLFVMFEDDAEADDCETLLQRYGLGLKRALTYARNAYFVAAPDNSGLSVF